MKYFYEIDTDNAVSNTESFFKAIESQEDKRVFISNSVANEVRFALRLTDNKVHKFANCSFQFSDAFVEVDGKGIAQEIANTPEWAISPENIKANLLVTSHGLDQVLFTEGMERLKNMPAGVTVSILKSFLGDIPQESKHGKKIDHVDKPDQRPKVQRLGEDEFRLMVDYLTDAVKNNRVIDMKYFISKGVSQPNLKRGFRTYFKALTSAPLNNVSGDTPDESYSRMVKSKLDNLKEYGLGLAYNKITAEVDKSSDVPLKEFSFYLTEK